MFDALSDRFDGIFSRMRGRGRLSESDIDEVAREIRLALLEADVNVRVVKGFIARIKERAKGSEVAKSLSPAQQVIKIVHEELVATLGGTSGKLAMSPKPPTVVMLAGLQGSGKTTAAGKLARHLKSQGLHPLLVAADLQRPAAVEQLRVLGRRIDVPVHTAPDGGPADPVEVTRTAFDEAARLSEEAIDRMKTEAGDVPLIAVGGGAFLIPEKLAGVSKVIHVQHGDCANAVGAAIAQVSGECDQIFKDMTRNEALAAAQGIANDRAVAAGADRKTLSTIESEDMPLAYLPGNSVRVRVRVVGDVAGS